MGKKGKKGRSEDTYVVVSYVDGERRLHSTDATSYRSAKRNVAKELREELGLWDVNLADLTSRGMMIARKMTPRL